MWVPSAPEWLGVHSNHNAIVNLCGCTDMAMMMSTVCHELTHELIAAHDNDFLQQFTKYKTCVCRFMQSKLFDATPAPRRAPIKLNHKCH